MSSRKMEKFINVKVLDNGGYIARQCNKIYFDEEKGYLLRVNRNNLTILDSIGLPTTLTDGDVAKMYRLSLTLHKQGNLLCYRSGNSLKAMNDAKIAKYLGISERKASEFLNRMIQNNIIARVIIVKGNSRERQYYINPIYFFVGKWLNVNLYLLFKNDLKRILPEWVIAEFEEKEGSESERRKAEKD